MVHGLQPARLLCPWDSVGNNTGVGCHFFLQGIFLTSCLAGRFFTIEPPGKPDSDHPGKGSQITCSLPLVWKLPEVPLGSLITSLQRKSHQQHWSGICVSHKRAFRSLYWRSGFSQASQQSLCDQQSYWITVWSAELQQPPHLPGKDWDTRWLFSVRKEVRHWVLFCDLGCWLNPGVSRIAWLSIRKSYSPHHVGQSFSAISKDTMGPFTSSIKLGWRMTECKSS